MAKDMEDLMDLMDKEHKEDPMVVMDLMEAMFPMEHRDHMVVDQMVAMVQMELKFLMEWVVKMEWVVQMEWVQGWGMVNQGMQVDCWELLRDSMGLHHKWGHLLNGVVIAMDIGYHMRNYLMTMLGWRRW